MILFGSQIWQPLTNMFNGFIYQFIVIHFLGCWGAPRFVGKLPVSEQPCVDPLGHIPAHLLAQLPYVRVFLISKVLGQKPKSSIHIFLHNFLRGISLHIQVAHPILHEDPADLSGAEGDRELIPAAARDARAVRVDIARGG